MSANGKRKQCPQQPLYSNAAVWVTHFNSDMVSVQTKEGNTGVFLHSNTSMARGMAAPMACKSARCSFFNLDKRKRTRRQKHGMVKHFCVRRTAKSAPPRSEALKIFITFHTIDGSMHLTIAKTRRGVIDSFALTFHATAVV